MPRRSTRCWRRPGPCAAASTSSAPSTTSCCSTASTSPSRRRPAATSAAGAGSSCATRRSRTSSASCTGRPRCRSCPRAAERLRGSGDAQERVMASAAYLAEHLAEVPAIVIPTIIGRHDGSGRPGLFDSVIQAAWSFCLALRARGPRHDVGHGGAAGRGAGQGDPRHPRAPDRDRAAARWRGRRAPTSGARRGTRPGRSRTFDRFGTTFRVGPGRGAALRRRARARRRGRRRRAAGRRVGARHRPRTLPARFSEEFLGAEWAGRRARRRAPCSSAATTTRRSASGRSRASSTRATSRASFGWCTSDPDDPGRPLAVRPRAARRPDPPAVHVRARARAVRHDGGHRGEPGQGGARPAPPARRGPRQHAAHGRGHQAARRGRRGDAARRHQRRRPSTPPASSSSARRSGSASTRCGCPSSGPPTR